MEKTKARSIVVLCNIRSTYNVGAIFRTADAVGVSEVWLVGYTPTPIDRFGRVRADIKKASLGAEVTVPWRHIETIEECVSLLREQGVSVVAIEQANRAIDYKEFTVEGDVACIFGNEIDGVPTSVVDAADTCLHIPMHGTKESLNVSVSAGIILFRLFDTN